MTTLQLEQRLALVRHIQGRTSGFEGRVVASSGLAIELCGFGPTLRIGDRLSLAQDDGRDAIAEVVAFHRSVVRAIPFDGVAGIGPGTRARQVANRGATLPVHDKWLGRVIDPLGRPLDQAGPVSVGPPRPIRTTAPAATTRNRLGPRYRQGIHALDLFTPCRKGQRMGLFAGSGVGKSTLLAMLASRAECDVVVVALVGERGREVRDFIEDELGPALRRAVIVVATSDQSPVLRREAAYAAMTVAEYFRASGRSVLLLMDSVTRFCHAMREIGLAAGEPPAARGYPASVIAELPRLLERAGPGDCGAGTITALFTVLVEGDDLNEPVADAVRGILDGHVVLSRRIAEAGRFPAVDVLRSISRTAPACLNPQDATLVNDARATLAATAELSDLVRLGAYQIGRDPVADRALRLAPMIEVLLHQNSAAPHENDEPFAALRDIMQDSHAA